MEIYPPPPPSNPKMEIPWMESAGLDTSLTDPSMEQANHLQSHNIEAPAQRPDGYCEPLVMDYPAHQDHNWAINQNIYGRAEHARTPQAVPSSRYDAYELKVIQHPKDGKIAIGKEKDRKPLDPPPLVELVVPGGPDSLTFLHNPYTMVLAYLEPVTTRAAGDKDSMAVGVNLTGTTASSLHRVKNFDNKDAAIFVFPDLAVREEGTYKLRFVLMVMEEGPGADVGTWLTITQCHSDNFVVHSARSFPGMAESTPLTRMFADQGIRLRLRKDSRQLTTKKQNHSAAYRLAGKRTREPSKGNDNDNDSAALANRRSISTHTRPYYESAEVYSDESQLKRQRTAPTGHPPYSMRQNVPTSVPLSYSGMGAIVAHQSQFQTTSESTPTLYTHSHHPREVFNSTMASMNLSRNELPRLDHQFPSSYDNMYPSHSTHSPANSFYPNPPMEASATLQHQNQSSELFQGGNGQLPAINRPYVSNNNQVEPTPQGLVQAVETPVSSTSSPSEHASYTHTTSQFPTGFYSHQFDQGTMRTHGISTPITAQMPHDNFPGSLLPSQMMSVGDTHDYSKAATEGG